MTLEFGAFSCFYLFLEAPSFLGGGVSLPGLWENMAHLFLSLKYDNVDGLAEIRDIVVYRRRVVPLWVAVLDTVQVLYTPFQKVLPDPKTLLGGLAVKEVPIIDAIDIQVSSFDLNEPQILSFSFGLNNFSHLRGILSTSVFVIASWWPKVHRYSFLGCHSIVLVL